MDAPIPAAQQPAAARQSASGCGAARESDAAAAAVAALDSTQRLLEYALLLGLSRGEAVAYLQRTAGLQPALTELGASAARAGTAPRWLTAPAAARRARPQCGTSWPRRTRSTSRSTRSAWPSGCAPAPQGREKQADEYLTRPSRAFAPVRAERVLHRPPGGGLRLLLPPRCCVPRGAAPRAARRRRHRRVVLPARPGQPAGSMRLGRLPCLAHGACTAVMRAMRPARPAAVPRAPRMPCTHIATCIFADGAFVSPQPLQSATHSAQLA